MLFTLVFFFVCFLAFFTVLGRFIVSHLHLIALYSPQDIYNWFKFKRWNECPNFGYIKIFNGYFGSGKTLSMTNEVINIYNRYNNVDIYDKDSERWIKQKITVISNLVLRGIPYVEFISEQQFIDYQADPGEVLIFLIDEIGTVWNNRDFKSFNPDVFNNIVQSRKRKMSIYGTLPVFQGTDISVRRYTDKVIYCSKWWRIVKHLTFSAQQLENCSNVEMLQPLEYGYMFVTNKMYDQYDTNAMIDKLKNEMVEGKLLTFNDLNNVNNEGEFKAAKLKKKYRARQK